MEYNNTNISILAGIFLLSGILAFILIPYVFGVDNVIFLTDENGGTPQTCTGNNGFVLAQNLTDLCDVTIISPLTNQIIKYNGSQWVNVAQATFTNETTVCSNVGGGIIIVKDSINGNCTIKSLFSGVGISITNTSNTITVTNTSPESTTSIDVGSGATIAVLQNQTGSNIYLRGIKAGNCMSVGEEFDTDILVSNTCGESTKIVSIGNGTLIKIGPNGPNSAECQAINPFASDCIKTLKAGLGLSISNNSNSITYVNTLPESTVCSGQAGNYNIVASSSGGNCTFKNLLAGSNINISSNSTHITISVTGLTSESTVCSNVGTGTIVHVVGSNCNAKSLKAGTGLSIANTTNDITYTNTGVTSISSDDTNTLTYSSSTGAVTTTPVLKKLCEFTGVGGETSITCTFSSSQQVFYIQMHYNSTVTNTVWALRFNNDSGTNYSLRSSTNGGADGTAASQTQFTSHTITANQMNSVFLECHDHASTFEKFCIGDRMNMAPGAGTAPGRVELYGKWVNYTNDITSINFVRTASTGTLTSSHIIVWGYS